MTTDPFAGLPPADATTDQKSIGRKVDGSSGGRARLLIDDRAASYTLQSPLKVDEVEYREVRVLPVTGGDRARFDRKAGIDHPKNVALLVRKPEGEQVPYEHFQEFDASDYFTLLDIARPLLAPHFPPPPKAPTFAGDAHRKTVFLEAPIDYNGKLYDRVEIRRLSAREISAFLDLPVNERGLMPAFYDDAGARVPDVVMEALGFEDAAVVGEAMDRFTPGASKAGGAPRETSAPETGENSPQP